MATAFEDAGFEIRDQLMWVFGSGFPKSHNIGKAIDKMEIEHDYDGYGTALKPAHEPIVMARKPLSEKSIAENVLKHGTGGINIDGSRIETSDNLNGGGYNTNGTSKKNISDATSYATKVIESEFIQPEGRFPANIIFDEEAGQLLDEQSGVSKSQGGNSTAINGTIFKIKSDETKLGKKSGFGDIGGASRFFYCPKAAKKDRNEGLDNFTPKTDRQKGHGIDRICGICGVSMLKPQDCKCEEPDWITPPKLNSHPTVKPTDLMRYLINLITPPNGTILDPFMGSGSTGKAAVRCGVNFIGIEKEQEYMDIASARIQQERNKPVQTKLL
jgi:site-specific DNA-methyltransferase (adenine-specific)